MRLSSSFCVCEGKGRNGSLFALTLTSVCFFISSSLCLRMGVTPQLTSCFFFFPFYGVLSDEDRDIRKENKRKKSKEEEEIREKR